MSVDPALFARINEYRRARGLSARGLALVAHVPIGEVLGIDSPDWDPLDDTLQALARIIPAGVPASSPVEPDHRLHNRASGRMISPLSDGEKAEPRQKRGRR